MKHNKEWLAYKAIEHVEYMDEYFKAYTLDSVRDTEYYNEKTEFNKLQRRHVTSFHLEPMDTVDGIYHSIVYGSVTALNFASYKHAGGGFLDGSYAQEEAICHESNLYNILRWMDNYYKSNMKSLNKGLYLSRGLYTPNVVFNTNDNVITADIITCAAPNRGVAMRQGISPENNYRALEDRVDFMLSIAAEHDPSALILGAWGCGVFKQKASELIEIYDRLLGITERFAGRAKYSDVFERVLFAIPNKDGKNYQEFKNYLNGVV